MHRAALERPGRVDHIVGEGISFVAGGSARKIIDGVDLVIPTGTFTALIGPSGCGKSTLLKLLAGILEPTSGTLLIGGIEPHVLACDDPLALGYLAQSGSFHDTLTVREMLAYSSDLKLGRGGRSTSARLQFSSITAQAGIDGFLDQRLATLSGGQRRRAAVAEVLTGNPDYLLLDELTSGLDPHSHEELMEWLSELARGSGSTVVLVTHSLAKVELCDQVILLAGGRSVYHGNPGGLLDALGAVSIAEVYRNAESAPACAVKWANTGNLAEADKPQRAAVSRATPGLWSQFRTLLRRQYALFVRDKALLLLHGLLLVTFPLLVGLFATGGLPVVRKLSLELEPNLVKTLSESLIHMKESFDAASLVSGLAMFQVILLSLTGANNGAREIARERDVLEKEVHSGLSLDAYLLSKFVFAFGLSLVQAFAMAAIVKWLCGFPGALSQQVLILFLSTLASSTICLAASAWARSPEKASLISLYFVGLQLPLSGAVLALPDILQALSRPVISAYWGWSGYLSTLAGTHIFEVVRETARGGISPYYFCAGVLAVHALTGLTMARIFLSRRPVRP